MIYCWANGEYGLEIWPNFINQPSSQLRRKEKPAPRNIGRNLLPRRSLTWLVLYHFETNIFSATSQESRPESLFYSHSRCQTRPAVVWSDVSKNSQTTARNEVSFLSFTYSTRLVSSSRSMSIALIINRKLLLLFTIIYLKIQQFPTDCCLCVLGS